MLSSLQCGLALVPDAADAAMFLPVDHPNIEAVHHRNAGGPVSLRSRAGHRAHLRGRARPSGLHRARSNRLNCWPCRLTAKASDVIHRHVARDQLHRSLGPGSCHRRRRSRRLRGAVSAAAHEERCGAALLIALLVVVAGWSGRAESQRRSFSSAHSGRARSRAEPPRPAGRRALESFHRSRLYRGRRPDRRRSRRGHRTLRACRADAGAHPLDQLILRQSRVLQSPSATAMRPA